MGGDHELLGLHGQQIIFPHDPHHSLVVDSHPPSTQLRRDSPVTVSATMFQSDLLNCRSYFHLFFHRVLFLQRPVEASAAHRHHLAHALDAEGCLATTSFLGSGGRCHLARAAAALASSRDLLQGTFEKSTSIVFSARSRFN